MNDMHLCGAFDLGDYCCYECGFACPFGIGHLGGLHLEWAGGFRKRGKEGERRVGELVKAGSCG